MQGTAAGEFMLRQFLFLPGKTWGRCKVAIACELNSASASRLDTEQGRAWLTKPPWLASMSQHDLILGLLLLTDETTL